MIVSFQIDWQQVTAILGEVVEMELDLFDISCLRGDLTIEMAHETLSFEGTSVLIDVLQIMNTFSDKNFKLYHSKTLPITIDDEPALYASFIQPVIQIHKYSPQRDWRFPNPVIHSISYEAAGNISTELKSVMLPQIQKNAPQMLSAYTTALFE